MAATVCRTTHRWSSWVSAWTALSLPGVGVAVLGWGPDVVLAVLAAVAAFAAFVVLVVEDEHDTEGKPRPAVHFFTGRAVVCAVVLALSTMAWLSLSPGSALLLVLVAGATAPPAVDAARRVLGRPVGCAAGRPGTAADLTALRVSQQLDEAARQLSDPELCHAWRQSLRSLGEAGTPAERLAVVLQRQAFMGELEARNAVGFERWLASGAPVSADPERFLNARADPTP